MKRKREQITTSNSQRGTFFQKIVTQQDYNSLKFYFEKLFTQDSDGDLNEDLFQEGVDIFTALFKSKVLVHRKNQDDKQTLSKDHDERPSNTQKQVEEWIKKQYFTMIEILIQKSLSSSHTTHEPARKKTMLCEMFIGKFFQLVNLDFHFGCFESHSSHPDQIRISQLRKVMLENAFGNLIRALIDKKNSKSAPFVVNCLRKIVHKYEDLKYLVFSIASEILTLDSDDGKKSRDINLVCVMGLVDKLVFSFGQGERYFLKPLVEEVSENKKKGGNKRQRKKKMRKVNPNVNEYFPRLELIRKQQFQTFYIRFLVHVTRARNEKLCKIVLLRLNDYVIPYFANPLLLSDFVKQCFKIGIDDKEKSAVLALLSIQSVFTLITKYNMSFPNYYENLYSLVDLDVLEFSGNENDSAELDEQRKGFLKLIHVSLQSTKVPEYIIASFVKKFMRISLNAPPHICCFSIALAYNLMRQYRTLVCMIHKEEEDVPEEQLLKLPYTLKEEENVLLVDYEKKEEEEIEIPETHIVEDVFDVAEKDLKKTRAMETYLWELETLENHYVPQVSNMVKRFKFMVKGGFKKKFNVDSKIDLGYQNFFNESRNKRMEIIPNFDVKKNAFSFE